MVKYWHPLFLPFEKIGVIIARPLGGVNRMEEARTQLVQSLSESRTEMDNSAEKRRSDQNAAAMVDLVLGDLSRPAFQRAEADAEMLVLIANLDFAETPGLAGPH